MAHEIQAISTSTIKVGPQPESTARTINLTPWDLDLLFIEYSQKGLLFLKPGPQHPPISTIDHLKQSLQRTLQFFPPLAGRLAATASGDGAATGFSIQCNDDDDGKGGGALFIHALTNLTVADVLDPSDHYVPEIVPNKFFPLAGVRNYDGVSQPLLAVQATELVDGLFIGCSMNHLLVDGTSFWHFVNSWAEISRAESNPTGINPKPNPISKLPFLNRDQVNLDITSSGSINIHNEHLVLGKTNQSMPGPGPGPLRDRVFHFTKQSISKLKSKANLEMAETSKGEISSLQALIAHVWRSIIRCRFTTNPHHTTDQETTFEIPIGARQRLNPPLPEEYFGNAIFPGIITLKVDKILRNGLGWTAWQINKMVASNGGPDKVKELYTNWIKKPSFVRFEGPPGNRFILINSPRFDVYGNDFGWGRPVAARSGRANTCDGRITIFGSAAEDGSVEIEACLFNETLSALAEDAEFIEFVA